MGTVITTTDSKELPSHFFKKSHKLVFSQLSLSPVEHDLFALFLSTLRQEDWDSFLNKEVTDSPEYDFGTQVLSEWFNVPKSNLFNVIKKPSEKLARQVIGIMDEKEKKFKFIPLFKSIEYSNGKLVISPNDKLMEEYLSVRQGHSQIPHVVFRKLHREYSKRLYSILCRFKDPSKTELHPFSIHDLYAHFGLLKENGALAKKTYANVGYLINRIIKPAISEIDSHEENIEFLIDEKSGNVGFSYKKEGRKVVGLQFLYRWNIQSYKKNIVSSQPLTYQDAESTFNAICASSSSERLILSKEEVSNLTPYISELLEKNKDINSAVFFDKFAKLNRYIKS